MPERSRWWEFEQFVREILQRTPGIDILDRADALFATHARKDLGFDIEAVHDGRPLLVEIKAQTPQTGARLSDLISQLQAAATKYVIAVGGGAQPELLAVFPEVLSRSKRVVSQQGTVEIWDGRDLRRRARQLEIPVPPLSQLLKEKRVLRIVSRQRS
jgi:Restriction endonuclease